MQLFVKNQYAILDSMEQAMQFCTDWKIMPLLIATDFAFSDNHPIGGSHSQHVPSLKMITSL